MKTMLFISAVILIMVSNLYPQNKMSIQLSGGIISPVNAQQGLSGLVQFNYSTSKNNSVYASLFTSSWDFNRINFNEDNVPLPIKSHDEENHILNSIYIGDRIIFNRNKYFNAYVDLELGYTHLNYLHVFLERQVNPDGTVQYIPNYALSNEVNENMLGTGVGVGIQHHMIDRFDLMLNVKLNTFNDLSTSIFDFQRTYLVYMFGFGYNIN